MGKCLCKSKGGLTCYGSDKKGLNLLKRQQTKKLHLRYFSYRLVHRMELLTKFYFQIRGDKSSLWKTGKVSPKYAESLSLAERE